MSMLAADRIVPLDIVTCRIQYRHAIFLCDGECGRKIWNFDEPEVNGHMPKAVFERFGPDALLGANARDILEADREDDHRLWQGSDPLDVVGDDRWHRFAESREEHGGTGHPCDVVSAELGEKPVLLLRPSGVLPMHGLDAVVPRRHDDKYQCAKRQRYPSAFHYFQEIGREKTEINRQQNAGDRGRSIERPVPSVTHYLLEESGCQDHGGGHGGAVSAREPIRAAESDRDGKRERHHRPVDEGNVNLAVLLRRRLADPNPGKPAELHGLP